LAQLERTIIPNRARTRLTAEDKEENEKMLRNLVPATAVPAVAFSAGAQSATFMDGNWASDLCKAWNDSETLTNKLGGKSWAANNAGRGYKIIQLYRSKCGEKSKVERDIADKNGKAVCTYGGPVKHADLNYDVDYLVSERKPHFIRLTGRSRIAGGAVFNSIVDEWAAMSGINESRSHLRRDADRPLPRRRLGSAVWQGQAGLMKIQRKGHI
jgi:hypothetical protein